MLMGTNEHIAVILPSKDTPTFAITLEACPELDLGAGDGVVFLRDSSIAELEINNTQYAFIPVHSIVGAVREEATSDDATEDSE